MKTNIVNLTDFKRKTAKDRILTFEAYREAGKVSYSYRMKKLGKHKVSDEFVAFMLARTIEDIVSYHDDPANILELTQEIMIRLGYDTEEEDENDS